MSKPRIISLIASATEIVCALGLGQYLVGCSHECDYPDFVRTLPRCSEPKFHCDGKSYLIDEKVKAILSDGLSIYRVDAELLKELQPTHIITQDHCKVCAVSPGDLTEYCSSHVGRSVEIISLHPNSLGDIFSDIQDVADAFGITKIGQELVAQLNSELMSLSALVATQTLKPKVACIEWIQPLMMAGNWIPELLELAHAEPVLAKAGEHSGYTDISRFRSAQVDTVVIMPCGFSLQRAVEESQPLLENGYFEMNEAASSVFVADGNELFNRPGPRITHSLAALIEMIYGIETMGGKEFKHLYKKIMP